MVVYIEEIEISTTKRREFINIMDRIEEIVARSKIKNGICLVFLPHATAALVANEDEPNIRLDYLNMLERLVPENDNYHHNIIDNNADSHLLSAILKQFYIFPVKNGRIIRGTWQELFFVELDGPRSYRRIIVVVLGE